MRAHALVLLTVLALIAPPAPARGGAPDVPHDKGQQLMRRGDYTQAEQFYADAATRYPNVATQSMLHQSQAALADGDATTAEAVLQQLLARNLSQADTASAYFELEQVRRAAGDCRGALRALDAFESAAPAGAIGPYAALQRAQCASILGEWSTELTAAMSALSIDGGGPRLTQIEALERAAEADLKLGRRQEALDFYTRSLGLAGTRAYTAEMLFTTATLARALGQTSLAADHYRAVVVDYADQARAPGALDALIDLGLASSVSPMQAGLARFNAKEYSAAIAQFDQVATSDPSWADAQLKRADALLQQSDEDDARAGLQAVVDTGAPAAASALLRLGQLDERNGDEDSAEAHYQQMAQAAPERTAEADLHVGFTRFVRGDTGGAQTAWQAGIASNPADPTLQAQLEYWSARSLPSGSPRATEAFNRAAAAAPESYYGLRAQEALNTSLTVATASASSGTAWLALSPGEQQEQSAWLAAQGTNPDQVARDVAGTPGIQRADQLLALGLRTEASWEVDGVIQQYAQNRDVAHMGAVADWTMAHDQPQLTLRIGKQMRDLVGMNGLPRALQKDVYPAAWGDLVAEQADTYHVDPLLMLALMRQESAFDPRAASSAQALGLTQIVPSTARTIAAKLGLDDFQLNDLYKPDISVEFGAWYLSQLLGQYHGRVFPTLAAYDAGPGNVSRWMQRFGDDPDLLVEQIPFSETQTYLRIVYDNYWHYSFLYRDGLHDSTTPRPT
jgi:soluble lytic murein transglycosylase